MPMLAGNTTLYQVFRVRVLEQKNVICSQIVLELDGLNKIQEVTSYVRITSFIM